MIEARGLTKRYGPKTAVEDLSFQVRPGVVTGFLGPNGSGKSTTMRMILGLDDPTSGSVTVDGRPFRRLHDPARTVGSLLDAKGVHGGRRAYAHLRSMARLAGVPASRVDEVLGITGLHDVGRLRPKGFSLGMGQRLGIAGALLGDPGVLLFDEPVNGLDPEGIQWVRSLMRHLASEGRTVFVASHLMSEMALTADHLIVIGRGRLLADMPAREFIDRDSSGYALVRTSDGAGEQRDRLAKILTEAGGAAEPVEDGALRVTGLAPGHIGDMAYDNGVRLHELSPHRSSLEEAYMRLTRGEVEFQTALPGTPVRLAPPAGPVACEPPAPEAYAPAPEAHAAEANALEANAPEAYAPEAYAPAAVARGPRPEREGSAAGLRAAVLSEWTKISSLRSNVWALLIMAASIVGIGGLPVLYFNGSERPGENILGLGVTGFIAGQLAVAVLGATVITSEYDTGLIRTTLIVCPKRMRVLAAKALVLAVTVFTAGCAAVGLFAALAVGLLGDEAGSPSHFALIRAVVGGGLYLALIALMSFAVGALLRRGAAAITLMVSVILLPAVAGVFVGGLFEMDRLGDILIKYSPVTISASLFRNPPDPQIQSGHLVGLLAVATAVLLAAASVVVSTRDV